MNKKLFSLLICSAVISLSSCTFDIGSMLPDGAGVIKDGSYFEVHYIDVGQADCELIICDGEAMLIDGGNVADSDLVVSYLDDMDVSEIEYMLCTHAHEDHVGGLPGPLSTLRVNNVYAPKAEADTKCYMDFKDKARASGGIVNPENGDMVELGSADVVFYVPDVGDDDLNNTSIMCRITYGGTSFLFTGDAEAEAEQSIMSSGAELEADVLKVAHHGSSSSTSDQFLDAVDPEYAVISCGKDNSYGHPHDETLKRLHDKDVMIYRTDMNGHIVAESDGNEIVFASEKSPQTQTDPYTENGSSVYGECIGNKNTKKYHAPDCGGLPDEKNRVYFSSPAEAEAAGYEPCSQCGGWGIRCNLVYKY